MAHFLSDTLVNSTFASTAIPIVRTIPAIPGRVSAAPSKARAPIRKNRFDDAMFETTPAPCSRRSCIEELLEVR